MTPSANKIPTAECCDFHIHSMERLTAVEICNKAIKSDVEDIKENLITITKLLSGRPSWFVCIIISFLMTLCGVLITIIETAKYG